jgi:hypothetical protein
MPRKKINDVPMCPPAFRSVRDMPGDWWIAHTKSRQEKVFAQDLLARAVPYFLPLLPRTIFSGGRHRAQMIVAFPGYVFFRGGDEQRKIAVTTDRLSFPIEVPPEHQAGLDDELAAVEKATTWAATLDQDRENEVEPYDERIEGQGVTLANGPLAGCAVVILADQSSAGDGVDVVLPVRLTGLGVRVRVGADAVRPTKG